MTYYTPDDYQQDVRDAQERYQDLLRWGESTDAELQELTELTAFLADHAAFDMANWYEWGDA